MNGRDNFRLAFEISPIILVGGSASLVPNAMLPIMAITESQNWQQGLQGAGCSLALDNFFAHYVPMAGASLIEQDIATYPFANQAVAANSIMTKQTSVSFQMIVPARGVGAYPLKLEKMMAIQRTLEAHNQSGGLYTLLTPSFIFLNCLMTAMRDAGSGGSKQVQIIWQLDFIKPLVTIADAQNAEGALNSLMQQFNSGSQINGQPSLSGATTASGIPATTGDAVSAAGGTGQVGTPLSTPGSGYSDSGFGANTPSGVAASDSGFTANTPAPGSGFTPGVGPGSVLRR